jgi:protein TonB
VTSSPVTLDPGDGPPAPREEPLATVLDLGGRENSLVFVVALFAALAVHGVAGARAARVFPYLAELAADVRGGMQERLRAQFDIDMNEPPPPKPEPEPPPPEPEPEPPPAARQKAPEPQAPPAAAEAGKVLTSDPDPDAPVDLTDEGFVSGTSDRFAGGVTASAGTAKTAVRNTAAVPTGVGTGTPKAQVVAAPKVDLSRPPSVNGTSFDHCPFPPEADAEGINFAKVQVVVMVKPDGRARSVTVVKDPGFGFGQAARACALRAAYSAASNATGQAVEQSINLNVKFTR